jgi:hypothetical protein
VTTVALKGFPRKTASLVATVGHETDNSDIEWLMMLMEKIAIGT